MLRGSHICIEKELTVIHCIFGVCVCLVYDEVAMILGRRKVNAFANTQFLYLLLQWRCIAFVYGVLSTVRLLKTLCCSTWHIWCILCPFAQHHVVVARLYVAVAQHLWSPNTTLEFPLC